MGKEFGESRGSLDDGEAEVVDLTRWVCGTQQVDFGAEMSPVFDEGVGTVALSDTVYS